MKEQLINIAHSKFAEKDTLLEIANKYGTPVYVVNPAILEKEQQKISGCFIECGINLKIFYSVKTNPLPVILKKIFELGCGAEIVNEFELELVEKLGLQPERIIVNGNVKSEKLIGNSIEKGCSLICLENLEELKSVNNIVRQHGSPLNISLRINPKLMLNPFDFSIFSSSNKYSGFTDSTVLSKALTLIKNSKYLKLKGINFHLGTNIKSTKPYKNAISQTFKIYKSFWNEGFEPEIIDIGGGFGFGSIHTINFIEALKIFGVNKNRMNYSRHSPDILPEIANYLSTEVKRIRLERKIKEPVIFIEPGRKLSAACQVLLLKVVDVHNGKTGRVYCNGGAMNISPLLLAEFHDITNLSAGNSGESYIYDIMGSMPTPLDVVSKGKRIKKITKGDILAVWDTGAYFTSLSNNFAGPRPAVVMVGKYQIILIKQRETVEDILGRDY